MTMLIRLTAYLVLGSVVLMSGCVRDQGAQNVLNAIAGQEIFKAGYILLQRPGGSQSAYSIQLDYGVGGCRPFALTEPELLDMLNNRRIPGLANRVFRFEMMATCMNTGLIEYASDQLSDRTFDGDGNLVTIDRPRSAGLVKQVDVSFSSGGVMNVFVFGTSLVATTATGARAADPLMFSFADIPAATVGRSGDAFAYSEVPAGYIRGEIGAVASNPSRFTLVFSLAAKQSRAADTLLLVWSDDIVLRTDI